MTNVTISSPTRFTSSRSGEGHFRLDHPEFGPGGGVFWISLRGKLGRSNTLCERGGGGFAIELAGLREVDFFVFEVIEFEKSAGAFRMRPGVK